LVFGGLLVFKPDVVPQQEQTLIATPRAIHFDPPLASQIRKDLNDKVVQVGEKYHQFKAKELNYMNILTSQTVDHNTIFVDVRVCSDNTVVYRYGVFGLRKTRIHEKICGSVRVHYERSTAGSGWNFKKVDTIDLRKIVAPK
jgi:hypothetical protein